MKVAALDLGTNTFLCLIAEGDRDGLRRVIRDEVEVVRLGQGVDQNGAFHPDALARAGACLARYRQMINEEKVDHVLGVATSAARDVSNGNALFALAQELDLPIQVIAGAEEARLSYLGACAEFNDDQHRLVVDIGGGSTELIVGRGRELLFSQSLDMGAVRLTERFVTRQPIPVSERGRLENFIMEQLQGVSNEILKNPLDQVLAVAGTPTSLAAIELGGFDAKRVDGYRISLARLKEWGEVFASTSVEEKKQKYNLGGRADIIYAGVSILRCLLEALRQAEVTVSVKGLRYGVALELCSRA
ncbi:MAG: Ppx/GppA family phosphatase [Bdellovibrionaceae bacterium]|nr:Ppx/GppA family phosphatase [Pseudobdellovibrionaceae bacterium]MBX3033705.1 Ppx/GppA family phosphatase [Pseudobdellovibrionaceae bacterium]